MSSFPPTALIADDEAIVREVAAAALRAAGFTVTAVADGKAAVDLVAAEPARFGVVVLDILMPVMDGRAALAAIRAIAPNLPVVLTSAASDGAADEPGVEYLPKPFRPAELVAVVRRVSGA